ncbi:hypothetical protein DAEQUDRAFT_431794 [Daedalea quercina L-15889]|uniref:Uncharacterized protein n=1 Tax=Daedalea quercina L-15889 TaxID=1314783 RepID=A0A165NG67_9APHY|nr:hypothetical protein DAEQUDRAFT_431794 [Daedalea quercina L-15889]
MAWQCSTAAKVVAPAPGASTSPQDSPPHWGTVAEEGGDDAVYGGAGPLYIGALPKVEGGRCQSRLTVYAVQRCGRIKALTSAEGTSPKADASLRRHEHSLDLRPFVREAVYVYSGLRKCPSWKGRSCIPKVSELKEIEGRVGPVGSEARPVVSLYHGGRRLGYH